MSSSAVGDSGLASCLSNVFKLAEVEGLKWVRYVGPNSTSLESPQSDPVLTSYAKLLRDGYACSWRRLSPSTDGVSGEVKDLWIFYFTKLPDLSESLSPQLTEDSTGSWEENKSSECSAMLFRALNGLIERSLLNENFLPLGKWFARPDLTMGSNGRGCFLCNFSFFIHAHLYICAGVDVRAGPSLEPLMTSHLHQALSSSSGMQVILSPSGLNAIMTGHSYQVTDQGIETLLDEWKLFYPSSFNAPMGSSGGSNLPAAVEVVLGGVRLRYPSQFVFVYHTEDSDQTPPPSPVDEGMMERIIQGGWEETMCVEPSILQKDCEECKCPEYLSRKDQSGPTSNKPSRPQRLLSASSSVSGETLKADRLAKHRFKPYATPPHPTDNATPMREHPVPSSLTLTNTGLSSHRKHLGPPKYTTPLPSPAVTVPSSPAIKPSVFPNHTHHPAHATTTPSKSLYDLNRVVDIITSSSGEPGHAQYGPAHGQGWWDCLQLPESFTSLQKMVSSHAPPPVWQSSTNIPSPIVPLTPSNQPLLMGGAKGLASPIRKVASNHSSSEYSDLMSPTKRRPSINKSSALKLPRKSQSQRASEVVAPASILNQDDIPEKSITIVQQDTLDLMTDNAAANIKPITTDFTNENIVKIGDLGNLFDDSEEEDEMSHKNMSMMFDGNHRYMYTDDISKGSRGNNKAIKYAPDMLHPPADLSHIYPTPPSVESTDEKFDDIKSNLSVLLEEKTELIETNLLMKLSPFDDVIREIIPDGFSSLNGPLIGSFSLHKKESIYHPSIINNSTVTSTHNTTVTSTIMNESVPRDTSSSTEPQKFIFPPPSSLRNRTILSLPLGGGGRDVAMTMSPLLSTPFQSLPSASPMRRFPRHFPSSAQTPLESPYDSITPTPLGVPRLTPVLPEAHALYINLALIDSALGANVSDNVEIDISAIQNILIKRSTWREHLDSVSSTPGGPSSGIGIGNSSDGGDLLKLEEEKPLMMAGIADYPSLGFKEDIMVTTPASGVPWNQRPSFPCLPDNASKANVELFIKLIQDYCLHLCLTGKDEMTHMSLSKNTSSPMALHPYQKNENRSKQTCRLYHTHSMLSAILGGKNLVSKVGTRGGPPVMTGVPPKQLPTQPSLDKEDNSAAWILDLLTLPTKFVTKKLRELRLVFQNSFHHAPCIKVSTKGPLSLRDLQLLTPSQTPAGDECLPLPMQPLVVGYDHEWISVSPLTIPSWDKLLLEPYSSPKHILYLVVCPNGDLIRDTVVKFFQNLSITYKLSRLGSHVPLDKSSWSKGIITSFDTKCNEDDKDVVKSIKKEAPPTSLPHVSPLKKICQEMIGPFLTKLPTDREELIDTTTHDISLSSKAWSSLDVPVFIVVYVVMRGMDKSDKSDSNDKVTDVMKIMSDILSHEEFPSDTRNRLLIQPLEDSELVGHQSSNSHHLRSLAFSVFSRCCNDVRLTNDAHHLTGFGPVSTRPHPTTPIRLYSPLFILSPDPPLAVVAPPISSTQPSNPSSILFSPDESTLFCSYCVSADKRWLLAVVCDRQAELLDTSVIGLAPNDIDGSSSIRYQPLERLWVYLLSTISTSVLKWNIVITRFGKPSSAEIREWPRIVYNDGLMTANQYLKTVDCNYCTNSSFYPNIKNVIVVSVQPERNIQLFPVTDQCPSSSHILVLPPHPNAISAMTPTEDDIMNLDFDQTADMSDSMMPCIITDDIFSGLNDMDIQTTSINPLPGEDAKAPLASSYLISTVPSGSLPNEFWGHDKPQSVCQMFKTLLHCHLSVHAFPGNPPDVLCSVLLAFDALSWLSINHVTRQRHSSLPLHIYLLSKMYNFINTLSDSSR